MHLVQGWEIGLNGIFLGSSKHRAGGYSWHNCHKAPRGECYPDTSSYQPGIMPHPQTNLRLNPDTRARAIAAAQDAGLSLSAYTERALIAYMAGVGGVVSEASTEIPGLGDVVSDLVSRVERIEQRLGVGMEVGTPATPVTPAQTAAPATPARPLGIPRIGDAVIAAGLCEVVWPRHKQITPAQCHGTNLDTMMRARAGTTAAEWLASVGWAKVDGLWNPPT